MAKKMVIGEVIGSHGVRGELKVRPLTDDPGRYYELDEVVLDHKGKMTTYLVELVRLHKGNVLLTLDGVGDKNTSDALKGALIKIDRGDAVDLSPDEYFISDLMGMKVVDGKGEPVGSVVDILTTSGSVDTVEIKTPEKRVYIPFRKIYFTAVNMEEGVITAQIPEELMNL